MTHHGFRRRIAAFTLCELVCAMAIVAVLAALSLPALKSAVHRARRADAHVALARLQMAQERHRGNHASYADLAALAWPTTTPDGHYRLSVSEASARGYIAEAVAVGPQAGDTPCRRLRVAVEGYDTRLASGAEQADNGDAANRACWSR